MTLTFWCLEERWNSWIRLGKKGNGACRKRALFTRARERREMRVSVSLTRDLRKKAENKYYHFERGKQIETI